MRWREQFLFCVNADGYLYLRFPPEKDRHHLVPNLKFGYKTFPIYLS